MHLPAYLKMWLEKILDSWILVCNTSINSRVIQKLQDPSSKFLREFSFPNLRLVNRGRIYC